MTPYRISAREERAREHAPSALSRTFRLVGATFAASSVACAIALAVIGGNDLRWAVGIGVWTDRALALVVPALLLTVGLGSARHRAIRTTTIATAGAWLAALAIRLPALRDWYALAVGATIVRVLAIGGLALLPFVAASRRVLPRWPLFAIIALAAGDGVRDIERARYHVPVAQFDPSASTLALTALVAYLFVVAARELAGESIDERADRFGRVVTALFPSEDERAAFLGPVRLATDAAIAFAIVTLVATTTTVAYSRSFRLDAPAAGAEASALVVVVTAALLRLKRTTNGISLLPIACAVVSTVAAVFSTMFSNGAALSVALLPLGLAVLGVGIVAPRIRDADARTMRRWVGSVSATGVLLASAGFFAIYSLGEGEPFIARLAKLGAVIFGLVGADAAARLELHARIEMVTEAEATET